MAALAAEAAEDAPRALMIAAPRPATSGMNVPVSHASSTCSAALRPPTTVLYRSGYWVAEWLPQIVMCSMAVTGTDSLAASCDSARLWSSRVIAVNRLAGTSGALRWAISALVLAGLPTTRTLMSLAACSLMALPCGPKIPPLAESRSPRSMPAVRGRAPTSRATLVPSKAVLRSSVMSMPASRGKAPSPSSIAVPSAACSAGVISSSRSRTGTSGPRSCPEAIRNNSA